MTSDPELDIWRDRWQSRDAVPPDVRRRVQRDIRLARLGFLSAIAVTVLLGGGTTLWAFVSGHADITTLAATWLVMAVTWAVSLSIEGWPRQWKPAATTTTAFLDFSISRRVATRRGIAAAAVLYAAFAAFMVAWRFQHSGGEGPADIWSYLAERWVFWTVTAVLAVRAVRRLRALGRELKVLRGLRQSP